jgi:polyadenylate-binding protein
LCLLQPFSNELTLHRIDNDGALRSKVEEALAVYDEYIKTQGGDGEAAKKDDKAEVAA